MSGLGTANENDGCHTGQQAHVSIDEQDHLLDIDTGNFRSLDVAADGVTPTNGVEYTFRVTFDYKVQTYSVEVLDCVGGPRFVAAMDGTKPVPPGATAFPLATRGSSISRVKFTGETTFTSLLGECANKLRGFVLRLF